MDPIVPLLPFMAENGFFVEFHTGDGRIVVVGILLLIAALFAIVTIVSRGHTGSQYEIIRNANRKETTFFARTAMVMMVAATLSYFLGAYASLLALVAYGVLMLVMIVVAGYMLVKSALGQY